jgi:hypothetical protein
MNKIFNLKSKFKNPEQGVTLLMSILIMASLFIITLTITFFTIQELRQSRANALSEPSIVAAETGGEQGIWLLKRSTFSDQCPADGSYQVDGTTSGSSRVRMAKCVSYEAATFELKPSEDFVFFLYDPTNINGNLCMERNSPTCDGAQLYSSVNFTHVDGGFAVTADIYTLDGVLVGQTIIPTSGTLTSINIIRDIVGSTDERLRVTLRSPDYATVTVDTEGDIGGMPDFPTVDSEGCSAHANVPDCNEQSEVFKRRINITVPQ